jgi:hypothetical protein
MRSVLIAGLLVAASIVGSTALAQGGGGGQGKDKNRRPPPPPIARCADLAIGDYTIGALAPDAPPLAEGEVAVRWEVRNAGGAPYVSSDGTQQWLALEYTTPGGPQRITLNPLPPTANGAAPVVANPNSVIRAEPITLGPGQSWRGYLRATLPAEAARRPLRLKLDYAPRRGPVQDCDMDNNTAPILRR